MALRSYLSWRNGLFVVALLSLVAMRFAPPPPPPPPASAAGPQAGVAGACASGAKTGKSEAQFATRTGLQITVRVPTDYDATRAYPLLVAYPPAGFDRAHSEVFYGLTPEATRRGFIVAYPEHLRLSPQAVREQANVPGAVADRFCIDASAVTFLGHSDGGTVAEMIPATSPVAGFSPRAIITSGAGVNGDDFKNAACPAIPATMILHSRDDRLFPGYGRSAAGFWAKCAGCATEDLQTQQAACHALKGCSDGRRVTFCETSGAHGRWPEMNGEMLDFIRGGAGG
jgi:polyhydroxybutyrate depolymerase